MNQLGKNISRREREQTLGRNVARLLAKVSSSEFQVSSSKTKDQRPKNEVSSSKFQVPSLCESELTDIAPLLCRSGAGALAWWRIRDTPLADTAAGRQLQDVYRRFRLSALLHEREIVAVISALREEGIEPVLVKGWAVARRYPDRALRPYGDIDLCVAPAQFAKAEAVLAGLRNISGPFVDLHSGFATIGVDTRRSWMRNIFSARSQRSNDDSLECGDLSPLLPVATCRDHRSFGTTERLGRQAAQGESGDRSPHSKKKDDNDWDELYARTQVVMLGAPTLDAPTPGAQASCLHSSPAGFPVRILRDEDHLRLLCVHLLRSGARRPAWLCDVALLIEQVSSSKFRVPSVVDAGSANILPAALPFAGSRQDACAPRFDWSICLGRNPVHAEWVGVAIRLAHELLGADISQTPFAGKQLPRWLLTETLRQWAGSSRQWAEGRRQKAGGREPSADYTDFADNTVYLRGGDLFNAHRRNLRNLRTVVFDLYRRWDNPIRATAAVGGRFDERARFRYRLAELLARVPEAPDHLRRLALPSAR